MCLVLESAPESCGPILSLIDAVQSATGTSPAPVIVHDDFGLGRSGVYIAICHGIWQIKVGSVFHQAACVLVLLVCPICN
jgi:hypothetical protein